MVPQAPPVIMPDVDEKLFRVLRASRRELSDDELAELCRKIRPVVRDDKGRCFYVDPGHPRDVAFNDDPIFMERADGQVGIVRVASIFTLHWFGPTRRFQASVAEVLAMVPDRLLGRITAFETVGPQTADDLSRQAVAVDAGMYVAVTHLYA